MERKKAKIAFFLIIKKGAVKMALNTLNDKQIKSGIKQHDEKVAAKQQGDRMIITSLPDGGGLRLELRDAGLPRWVFRYTRPGIGKPNEIKIGIYPDISLAVAREIASANRAHVQQGVDPSALKIRAMKEAEAERVKASRTFGVLLHEFLSTQNWANSTEEKNRSRIKNHLGKLLPMALDDITPRLLLDEILRPIRAADTQKRVRLIISQVFIFAIASGDTFVNPARDIAAALPKHTKKNFAAAASMEELKRIWQAISAVKSVPVRCALELQFLLFQRPYNIRSMEWSELNIESKVWTIPAKKMKLVLDKKATAKDHRVPLSAHAIEVISCVPQKDSIYLFPSIRTNARPISDATMTAALRGVGIGQEETTCHGSRAAASTLMNESGLFSSDAIERQLAHALAGGEVRNAYNRGDFWEERQRMMEWWGELLYSFNDDE